MTSRHVRAASCTRRQLEIADQRWELRVGGSCLPPPARGRLRVVIGRVYSHPAAATVRGGSRLCHRIAGRFSGSRAKVVRRRAAERGCRRRSAARIASRPTAQFTPSDPSAHDPFLRAAPRGEAPPPLDTVPCKLGAECASLDALEWYHRALPSAPRRQQAGACAAATSSSATACSTSCGTRWCSRCRSRGRWRCRRCLELLSMAYKFGRWGAD